MSQQPSPGSEFLRALAAAALRDGDPAALAERAAAGLAGVFASQKNLVLDVQFTGFLFKGKPLGGVDPTLLRAAGQLIVLRLSRVGFTPEASAGDLRVFFDTLALPPVELAAEGVLGRIAAARPHGIYLSTSSGEVYRPPRRAAVPASDRQSVSADDTTHSPAAGAGEAETSAPRGGGGGGAPALTNDVFGGDGANLSDFELLDDFPTLAPPAAPAASTSPAGAAGPPADARGGDVPSNDMFHFFRTAHSDRGEEEAARLPGLLRAAENPARFDELAEAATRAVQRMVRSGEHADAVELLETLVAEAERPDRTRIFRESAEQALRRVGTPETLHQLQARLEHHGTPQERERILRFFAFMGGDGAQLLETVLFRTGDPDLRLAVFRHLLRVEGAVQRVAARSLGDASTARTRLLLELATLPELDPELAARWLSAAAGHADAEVRTDAARHAATLGGRGGLRILLDVLNGERDPAVKRVAVQALGALGDPAAVPFLVRVVGDGGDEGVQVAAIVALGRLGSGEALPALLGVVNRRGGLFAAKKLSRPRSAAIAAIARIDTPAAREVMLSLAGGKDAEIAAEAQRVMGTTD
jgi:HEAT repeat protein